MTGQPQDSADYPASSAIKGLVSEKIFENVKEALARTRTAIFLNMVICAIVLSNLYLDHFSYDQRQMENSYTRQEFYSNKIKDITHDPHNKIRSFKEMKDQSVIVNKLRAKIDRIKNTREEYKLMSINIPFLGISVPANDANIICGMMLIFVSVWISFSCSQICYSYIDPDSSKQLKIYNPAVRHAVLFIVPEENVLLKWTGILVIALPAITITFCLLHEIYSYWRSYEAIIQLDLRYLTMLRIIILLFEVFLLYLISIGTIIFWQKFRDRIFS